MSSPSSIIIQTPDANSNSTSTPGSVPRTLSSRLPPPTAAQRGLLKIIQHKEKRKAYTIELFVHFVFMGVFFTVLFLQRDVYNAFLMNQGIISALITQPIGNVNLQPFSKSFMQLGQWEDIRDYLNGVLLPAITQNVYYSNISYQNQDLNYIQYYNRIIGGIRLRQLRLQNVTCNIPSGFGVLRNVGCLGSMDTAPFGPSYNKSKYTYEDSSTTGSSSIWGYAGGWYEGGGYVVDIPLSNDTDTYAQAIDELIADQWWGKSTQVMIVTINFLNVNLGGRICVLYLMIEFTQGGFINAVPIMKSFRLSLYSTGVDRFRGFLEVVFAMMVLYYFFSELRQIIRTIRADGNIYSYLFDVWNIIELINVVMFSISIIMYLAYLGQKNRSNIGYLTDARYLHELEALASFAINLYNISAFNILLTAFRTFKYLQLNDRLYMLWKALRFASMDLAAFMMLFLVMLFAFMGMGILSFGADTTLFNTFGNSFGTCWNFVMGNPPDYGTLYQSNRVLGAIFFSGFAVFVFFILVSMFVAILSDAFSEVKQKTSSKPFSAAIKNRLSQVVGRVKNLVKGKKLISAKKLIKRMKDPSILNKEDVTIDEMKAAIGPGTTESQAREMMSFHEKLVSGQYDNSILSDIPLGTLPRKKKDSQMDFSPAASRLGTSSNISVSSQDYDLAALRADVDTLNDKLDAILELINALTKKPKQP